MGSHQLELQGTGYFSRGRCTGCEWTMKGHADEITRVWGTYHDGDQVKDVPQRVTIPALSGIPVVDTIEWRLIQRLANEQYFARGNQRPVALGLAEARTALLGALSAEDAAEYVSIMTARISHLPKNSVVKLIRRETTRERMQEILEDI